MRRSSYTVRLDSPSPRYYAVWFMMGNYNTDDVRDGAIPAGLVGFDCPFDDSLVICADSASSLEQKVAYIRNDVPVNFNGGSAVVRIDLSGAYPDVIFDREGDLAPAVQRKVCRDPHFSPDRVEYSHGRETLREFWERERWRFLPKEART